jgi:hypothetical protein
VLFATISRRFIAPAITPQYSENLVHVTNLVDFIDFPVKIRIFCTAIKEKIASMNCRCGECARKLEINLSMSR